MINKLWNGRRYYSLDAYLKNTYGEKLYKLPLSAKVTCPNRDGTLGSGGCIFCSEGGSGDFAQSSLLSITDQIEAGKKQIEGKFSEGKYIAYFQSFTSTYGPIDYLEEIFFEAINHKDIAVLSIATRPDCLGPEVIKLLSRLKQIKPVWVELGLQTSDPKSAVLINRGYENDVYENAVNSLHDINVKVITHIILGLPGETATTMVDSVKYACELGTDGIKLQLLHVLKNTRLLKMYENNEFNTLEPNEYFGILSKCLEVIPPHVVIHRITGDGPKDILVAPTWSGNKKKVLNDFNHFLKENDSYQGKMV